MKNERNCQAGGCPALATWQIKFPVYNITFLFCDACVESFACLVGTKFGEHEKIPVRTDLPTEPGYYWADTPYYKQEIVEVLADMSVLVHGSKEKLHLEQMENYTPVAPKTKGICIHRQLLNTHGLYPSREAIFVNNWSIGPFDVALPDNLIFDRTPGNKLILELEILNNIGAVSLSLFKEPPDAATCK